eukprot:scaffold6308_cov80-Skeletonema_marinoi.AAC.1
MANYHGSLEAVDCHIHSVRYDRVVPRLKQVFVNVGSADKLSLLVDIVAGGERQKREQLYRGDQLPLTLVFCNTVSSCRAAEHALSVSGVTSLCIMEI